jgi:hypothetical protein
MCCAKLETRNRESKSMYASRSDDLAIDSAVLGRSCPCLAKPAFMLCSGGRHKTVP